jgi:psp operon transcriptional activator
MSRQDIDAVTARESRAHEALGRSEAFVAFQETLSRVARVDRPVLIVGERGSGKELAARRLHYLSDRWQKPLVALNCSALAPTLIESELFGYEAGAFTGAAARRPGRFEAADAGTLFLDELGNVPVEVQEKILRVIEYGTFERVGSAQSIQVDVRIVGATNADLKELCRQGRFKQDLLDRLSFEVLFLPPLRHREGDVMLLANHFAARMAFELGREGVPEFSDEAIAALEGHGWPGNVRELKNVVERAVYRAESDRIDTVSFDPFQSPFGSEAAPVENDPSPPAPAPPGPSSDLPFRDAVRQLEIRMLRRAMQEAKHNQREAARLLGLTYHQMRGLRRKYRDEL